MWKAGQCVTIDHTKFRVKRMTKEQVIDLVKNHGFKYEYDPNLPVSDDSCFLINGSFPSLP